MAVFASRQVSMHVQQLGWQGTAVPEVGQLLTRLVATRGQEIAFPDC